MKRSTVVALCISVAGICVTAGAFVYFVILTPQTKVDSHSDHTDAPTQWVEIKSNWIFFLDLVYIFESKIFPTFFLWRSNYTELAELLKYVLNGKSTNGKWNHSFFSSKSVKSYEKSRKTLRKEKSHEKVKFLKRNVKHFR